ncbi:hypothetical protein WEI85_13010 [Actinomycetes bacterium KLBMP 9797]
MGRHFKSMFYSMLAAKIGHFLRRRGHHSAASMVEHQLHRKAGHGHYGHGPRYGYGPQPGPHYGYHGHYKQKHYGYHGHYKKRRRRYHW